MTDRLATILTIVVSALGIIAFATGFAFYLAGFQLRDPLMNKIDQLRNEVGKLRNEVEDLKDLIARESARVYNLRVQNGLHENILDDVQGFLEKDGFRRRKNHVPENTDFK